MKKVAVAMSGGVDSSLAAAILKKEGYDVFGVSLRVFDPGECQESQEKTCCSARDIRDARRVAAHLDIPFSSWDVRSEFEKEVIAPFSEEYLGGRTPNPCVLCNSRIKFGHLLEKVEAMGARWLATGHYAGIARKGGEYLLQRGADRGKDQSYFLFEIGAGVLPRVLFPLGGLSKDEVRRRAGDLGLPVADKKESQEICFVPGNDYGAFLKRRLSGRGVEPGPIIDTDGRRLGTHRGLIHYTVGQRRGLGVAAGAPLYVLRIDGEKNTIVVGEDAELSGKTFHVLRTTWLRGDGRDNVRAEVKIRNRHRQAPATIHPLGGSSCRVEFDTPQRAVTPGQAAVFYDGDTVLGGGWIRDIEAH
jgi:tRNA-specific 2-thiouridylase